MDDRRKFLRFDLTLPSSLELVDPTPEMTKTPLDLYTRDVSSNGAFFSTPAPLPAGTHVNVNMVLKTDILSQESGYPTIKATGTVVRTEPGGMAVCFDSPGRLER